MQSVYRSRPGHTCFRSYMHRYQLVSYRLRFIEPSLNMFYFEHPSTIENNERDKCLDIKIKQFPVVGQASAQSVAKYYQDKYHHQRLFDKQPTSFVSTQEQSLV